ncbi:MAG TPA: LysR family transcriptional regulator [Polyangiaceae bacterium]|nr:LysR family transcriptional regulator [Polyangiaceae bacterium]
MSHSRTSRPNHEPRLEQMNLNLLLALHWLLVERSVTRAAVRLGVTQSAMSRSLGLLREWFGDQLLVPADRKMLLTARAAGLCEPLTASLDGLRGLLRPPQAFEPATATGTVRMAATEHALGALVHEFVGRLTRRAPLLDVQIEPAGRDVFSQLTAGRLDLLVVPKVGRLPEDLRAADLLRERFLSIVRQGHPVARQKLTLRRFCALQHVVVYPLGGDADSVVSRVLTQRGLERRIVVRVPYFESARRIVAETDYIATLPNSLAKPPASQRWPSLVCLEPPMAVPGFVLQAVWHRRHDDDPLQRWLRDLLESILVASR